MSLSVQSLRRAVFNAPALLLKLQPLRPAQLALRWRGDQPSLNQLPLILNLAIRPSSVRSVRSSWLQSLDEVPFDVAEEGGIWASEFGVEGMLIWVFEVNLGHEWERGDELGRGEGFDFGVGGGFLVADVQ